MQGSAELTCTTGRTICGSGAPGTSICPPAADEEGEVISAAFCAKREKGEADGARLPPVPKGASVSAAALLREVKGRKETIFFLNEEEEEGEE